MGSERTGLEARHAALRVDLVRARNRKAGIGVVFFSLGVLVGLLLAAALAVPIAELMGLRV